MAARDYDVLYARRERLVSLANGGDAELASAALAALMTVDGHIDPAWELAWGSADGFRRLLASMPLLGGGYLQIALAQRTLPLLDDEALSLQSGWPDEERLVARRAIIAALESVPGLEHEVRAVLDSAREDPALELEAATALQSLKSVPRIPSSQPTIRRYTMDDLAPRLDWAAGSRSFARGRRAYHEVGCHRCHVTSEHDTLVGPSLTDAKYQPTRRELAEAIIAPDKQIAENYRQYLLLVDGKPVTGLVTEQTKDYLVLIVDPMHDCTPQRIERGQLDEEPEPLRTSAMPAGMCDVLSEADVLDLLAYVDAKGDPRHASFRRQESP
jgi:putative heme-binding domain-containing protein